VWAKSLDTGTNGGGGGLGGRADIPHYGGDIGFCEHHAQVSPIRHLLCLAHRRETRGAGVAGGFEAVDRYDADQANNTVSVRVCNFSGFQWIRRRQHSAQRLWGVSDDEEGDLLATFATYAAQRERRMTTKGTLKASGMSRQ
jgi:hypothetical protein